MAEELKDLIEAKAEGKTIVVAEEAPAGATVLDLMQALEASLAAAKKGGGRTMASEVAKVAAEAEADGADDKPKPARKAAANRKAPAKRTAASRKSA